MTRMAGMSKWGVIKGTSDTISPRLSSASTSGQQETPATKTSEKYARAGGHSQLQDMEMSAAAWPETKQDGLESAAQAMPGSSTPGGYGNLSTMMSAPCEDGLDTESDDDEPIMTLRGRADTLGLKDDQAPNDASNDNGPEEETKLVVASS